MYKFLEIERKFEAPENMTEKLFLSIIADQFRYSFIELERFSCVDTYYTGNGPGTLRTRCYGKRLEITVKTPTDIGVEVRKEVTLYLDPVASDEETVIEMLKILGFSRSYTLQKTGVNAILAQRVASFYTITIPDMPGFSRSFVELEMDQVNDKVKKMSVAQTQLELELFCYDCERADLVGKVVSESNFEIFKNVRGSK